MLEVNIIEKKYFNKTVLNNICFTITEPGIYGFIGLNGAGKTTLFECLSGIRKFTGNCSVNGNKMSLNNIGYIPTEPFLYEQLTSKEFITFYRELFNIQSEIPHLLFTVPDNKLIKNLSTGTRKKVYINAVFQKKFKLYLLDEPFNGLDIESNYVLIEDLKRKAKDSIIIVSSHIIEILYKNCSRIFLLKNKGIIEYAPEDFYKIEADFSSDI